MVEIQKTDQLAAMHGIKMLCYGPAGSGKTRLVKTMGNESSILLISHESGVLSLRDVAIDTIVTNTLDDVRDALRFVLQSEDAQKYTNIAIDSLSEIAEVCLAEAKTRHKNGLQAYGELNDTMGKLIRLFRDLPGRNVYFSAKMERVKIDDGGMLYQPAMPGRTVGPSLPYFFDEVFALRTQRDEAVPGGVRRWLQTVQDGVYDAKDRSGALAPEGEDPHLGAVMEKIATHVPVDHEFLGDEAATGSGEEF